MSDQPIKATSKEFTSAPFYLVQSNGSDKRYVVSLRDSFSIRLLLAGFINRCQKEVQLKVRDLDLPEKPIDYSAVLLKNELHALMTKHEEVIFHNGYHDLMIRNPDSGEYMAFDEHGLVFIYTDGDYREILKNLKVAYRPDEKLLYEFEHWHYSLPDGRKKLDEMIKDFGLKKD